MISILHSYGLRPLDVKLIGRLKRYGVVLCIGTVAPIRSVSKSFHKVHFVHGALPYEFKRQLLYGCLISEGDVIISSTWWINIYAFKFDLNISHSFNG
ncbi:MAG: hypothetical protein QXW44_08125, partial [Pyrobaculum sp.]